MDQMAMAYSISKDCELKKQLKQLLNQEMKHLQVWETVFTADHLDPAGIFHN
jgi:rubrerythrin